MAVKTFEYKNPEQCHILQYNSIIDALNSDGGQDVKVTMEQHREKSFLCQFRSCNKRKIRTYVRCDIVRLRMGSVKNGCQDCQSPERVLLIAQPDHQQFGWRFVCIRLVAGSIALSLSMRRGYRNLGHKKLLSGPVKLPEVVLWLYVLVLCVFCLLIWIRLPLWLFACVPTKIWLKPVWTFRLSLCLHCGSYSSSVVHSLQVVQVQVFQFFVIYMVFNGLLCLDASVMVALGQS